VKSRNLVLTPLMSLIVSMLPSVSVAAAASKLLITSPVISDGATIPTQFTCSGAGQSPPLSFSGVPPGTKSLALLVEDPDAPAGTFVHWIVYDIPPDSPGFKAGASEGKSAANGAGSDKYMGPCPPPGKPHHYHFKLFALDTNPDLGTAPNARAFQRETEGHVIQSAELVGIFGR
jgi:Raf kinase inhibitor-like YbhB/YbcL family protein